MGSSTMISIRWDNTTEPPDLADCCRALISASLSSCALPQIISTAVMTYTKHFDQHGRIKEIQYEIFRSLMYWITIQYDNVGRVTKREVKIGPFANTTKYGYEYDVDGQLQTVSLNEKIMWR